MKKYAIMNSLLWCDLALSLILLVAGMLVLVGIKVTWLKILLLLLIVALLAILLYALVRNFEVVLLDRRMIRVRNLHGVNRVVYWTEVEAVVAMDVPVTRDKNVKLPFFVFVDVNRRQPNPDMFARSGCCAKIERNARNMKIIRKFWPYDIYKK